MIEYAIPAGTLAVVLVLLLVVRRRVLKRLFAQAAVGGAAHEALEVLRVPSFFWVLAGASSVALEFSTLPADATRRIHFWILAFLIVSLSLVVSSLLVRALETQGRRRKMAFATSGLAKSLVRVVIFGLGASVLLGMFGMRLTPLLTALGVGGVAVALALKDTLENLFAGILILIEEPIALGHYIRLSDTDEGIVTDIGWRTTRIRNGRNSTIVIPNSKLTSAVVTNHMTPDRRVAVDLHVHIGHGADARRAMAIALDVVRSTPGVLPEPEPAAFFNPGLLPTHLQFSVWFSVASFPEQGPVLSAVRLALLDRLREDGVPLARPEVQ